MSSQYENNVSYLMDKVVQLTSDLTQCESQLDHVSDVVVALMGSMNYTDADIKQRIKDANLGRKIRTALLEG